jgi:hypothetical protein
MAHITTVSHGDLPSVPRRSYLSTQPFNTVIYSYSTALVNQVYVGTLSVLSTATPTNCPAGRILHETGKKLFPGANNGVNDYMVSVYDPISMLTGFINPNQPFFSLMNTDRANFFLDGPNGTGTGLTSTARANALYTRGDVLAQGRLDLSGNALIYGSLSTLGNHFISTILRTIGNEYVGGNLSTIGTLSVGGTVNFKNNLVVGNATLGAGGVVTVSTGAVTTNSKIYLTFTGFSGSTGFLKAENIVANTSFQIVSSQSGDRGSVNWLVVN